MQRRFKKSQPPRKDSEGRPLCRHCGEVVRPPRRTFCDDECVHHYLLQHRNSYLRSCVRYRDRGVCSICGIDTRNHVTLGPLARKRLSSNRSPWDADHILPVVLGGGACSLENVRTLCVDCHVSETARLRAVLAEVRDEYPTFFNHNRPRGPALAKALALYAPSTYRPPVPIETFLARLRRRRARKRSRKRYRGRSRRLLPSGGSRRVRRPS